MYSLTIFKNLYDTKTERRIDFDSWEEFVKLLRGLSKFPKKSKRSAELISPAIYKHGTKRANANVIEWASWCAVDVDNVDMSGHEVESYVQSLLSNTAFICYSTASSKVTKPKFRIVIKLDRSVSNKEIRHFWYALNKELGEIGDGQCKDLSRMYFVPADYNGAFNFFYTFDGDALSVSELLAKHEYTITRKSNSFIDNLPKEIQKKVIEHRKTQMENKNIHWTNYKDCPFVNQKLVNEFKRIAFTDNSGRYSMIYNIMVSIASLAIKHEYPITSGEIVQLIREIDLDTANRYEKRPLETEANRAIEFAYRSN